MKYYAAQIKSSYELAYIKNLQSKLQNRESQQQILFPRRCLKIKKNRKILEDIKPLFPGYIFISVEKNIDNELFQFMKSTKGFYKFLDTNQNIKALSDSDLDILLHFLDFGEIVGISKVDFDINNHIIVKKGPLSGLEGNIKKVDRRKHRAKIEVQFGNNTICCDLAFEKIEKDKINA